MRWRGTTGFPWRFSTRDFLCDGIPLRDFPIGRFLVTQIQATETKNLSTCVRLLHIPNSYFGLGPKLSRNSKHVGHHAFRGRNAQPSSNHPDDHRRPQESSGRRLGVVPRILVITPPMQKQPRLRRPKPRARESPRP